ncbi:mitochondrial 39-S ribosomal protein L47 (MRP-L47)-domain-containing protein [Phaeosphaeria sp. MPI-PUGE-AT-0046c]|nr:mitochondrial 39-S ribosomal protein L47 (MRP-L47)-domain-containing protein [Phaeosphaeria sp. MPI-PUGE-AT-0046c]
MTSIHSRILRPTLGATTIPQPILAFLAPSAQCPFRAPAAQFSTSPIRCKGDNNPKRGLSAIRGTGLRKRQKLSVMRAKRGVFDPRVGLPVPTKITQKIVGTPDHGLWDFFKDEQLLQTPVEESKHGREWTVGELRSRDFRTLHQLWWICVKERNRLATEKLERRRLDAGYGDVETKERDETVQKTMKAILDTLAERQQAYTEAYELAKIDPEVDLSRTDGPQFTEPIYDQFEPEDEPPSKAQP